MLELKTVSSKLEQIALKAGVRATMLGVEAGNKTSALLGTPDTFLYVSEDDLASPERKALTARLIQRHFR